MTIAGLSTATTEELRDLCDRIGNTPVARLAVAGGELRLKLEGENPGGSVKDRLARFIVRRLRESGRLRPGDRLVDSTSGNFGVAMAWVARAHGNSFTAVTDPNATPENVERMRELGARVVIVDERDETGGWLLTRVRAAAAMVDRGEADLWVNQYSSPENPACHELETAPELLRDVGAVDAVFVAASTGGTLAGVLRHVRRARPGTAVVAVDGPGSVVFGGPAGRRLVNGLGSSRPSDFVTHDAVDEVVTVDPALAFAYSRELAARRGISIGGSAGAVVAAAAAWAARREAAVACLCADSGAAYRSTILDDAWVAAQVGVLPELTEEWLPRPPLALSLPPRRAGRPRRRAPLA